MAEGRSAESFVAEWLDKIRIDTRRILLKGIGDKLCDLGQVIHPVYGDCEKRRRCFQLHSGSGKEGSCIKRAN